MIKYVFRPSTLDLILFWSPKLKESLFSSLNIKITQF